MNQLEIYEILRERGPMTVRDIIEFSHPDRDPKEEGMVIYGNTVRNRLMQLRKWKMVDCDPQSIEGRMCKVWRAL